MTEARLCVVCPVRRQTAVHYERAMVCQPCRIWLAETIADIAALYPQLREALEPGRGNSQRVTGSREMPLPLNVDVLDLTGPAREHVASDHARLWAEDQTGHAAIAYQLDQWARDWISYDWCRSDHLPLPTVPELAAWLARHCDDACDHHGAVDDFAGEIRDLHGAMRAYIPRMVERDEPPPRGRPEPRTAPCRGCDLFSLWWWPSDERVRCDNCEVVMTEDEYAAWAKLVLAGLKRGAGV
jgi:hypothetical protein